MCILPQLKTKVIQHINLKRIIDRGASKAGQNAAVSEVGGKPHVWFLGTKRKKYFKEEEVMNSYRLLTSQVR